MTAQLDRQLQRAGRARGTLASRLADTAERQVAARAVPAIVGSPAFLRLWRTALTAAHSQLLLILRGRSHLLAITGSALTVNVPVAARTLFGATGLPRQLDRLLPAAIPVSVTILNRPALGQARTAVHLTDTLSHTLLPADLALALAGLAAARRRRRALAWFLIPVAALGILGALGVRLLTHAAGSPLVTAAAAPPRPPPHPPARADQRTLRRCRRPSPCGAAALAPPLPRRERASARPAPRQLMTRQAAATTGAAAAPARPRGPMTRNPGNAEDLAHRDQDRLPRLTSAKGSTGGPAERSGRSAAGMRWVWWWVEQPGKLVARADAELGEHLPQVVGDGVRADEQPRGDLGVGGTLSGQPGNLGFLRGQGIGCPGSAFGGVPADRAQLDPRPFREGLGTKRAEHLVRGA